MSLFYEVNLGKLHALIEEEVAKAADEAYAEGGQSLYDGIILTQKDWSTVDRLIDDGVNTFASKEDTICIYSPDERTIDGKTVVIPRLEFYLPDLDMSRWPAALVELDRYVSLFVCAAIFQERAVAKVPEYTARATAACTAAITLLKTRRVGSSADILEYIKEHLDRIFTEGQLAAINSGATEGMIDDIDNKQDITDNSLETVAKTIVGGINEVRERANSSYQKPAGGIPASDLRTSERVVVVNKDANYDPETTYLGELYLLNNKTLLPLYSKIRYNDPEEPQFWLWKLTFCGAYKHEQYGPRLVAVDVVYDVEHGEIVGENVSYNLLTDREDFFTLNDFVHAQCVNVDNSATQGEIDSLFQGGGGGSSSDSGGGGDDHTVIPDDTNDGSWVQLLGNSFGGRCLHGYDTFSCDDLSMDTWFFDSYGNKLNATDVEVFDDGVGMYAHVSFDEFYGDTSITVEIDPDISSYLARP